MQKINISRIKKLGKIHLIERFSSSYLNLIIKFLND